MRNLCSLVTKLVASAFHAFVQSRLKAELSDPDIVLMPGSSDAAVNNKPALVGRRPLRESQTVPIQWTRFPQSDVPTIGVL
jgi:hypothetical protein